MKQIGSTRLVICTALLFGSTASALLAQSDVAFNSVPHLAIPVTNPSDQTQKGGPENSSVNVALDTHIMLPSSNPEAWNGPSLTPGTPAVMPGAPAKDSALSPKPSHKSSFSVEPDYLPSWITNQPLSSLKYGAVPAVVMLHFGHN